MTMQVRGGTLLRLPLITVFLGKSHLIKHTEARTRFFLPVSMHAPRPAESNLMCSCTDILCAQSCLDTFHWSVNELTLSLRILACKCRITGSFATSFTFQYKNLSGCTPGIPYNSTFLSTIKIYFNNELKG